MKLVSFNYHDTEKAKLYLGEQGVAEYQYGPVKTVDKIEGKIQRSKEKKKVPDWPISQTILDPVRSTVSFFDAGDMVNAFKAISAGAEQGLYNLTRFKNKFITDPQNKDFHDPKKNPIRSLHLNVEYFPNKDVGPNVSIIGELQLQVVETTILKKAQHKLYSLVRLPKEDTYNFLLKTLT